MNEHRASRPSLHNNLVCAHRKLKKSEDKTHSPFSFLINKNMKVHGHRYTWQPRFWKVLISFPQGSPSLNADDDFSASSNSYNGKCALLIPTMGDVFSIINMSLLHHEARKHLSSLPHCSRVYLEDWKQALTYSPEMNACMRVNGWAHSLESHQ